MYNLSKSKLGKVFVLSVLIIIVLNITPISNADDSTTISNGVTAESQETTDSKKQAEEKTFEEEVLDGLKYHNVQKMRNLKMKCHHGG